MKLTFLLMIPLIVSACFPEKPEEKKIDSMIQQEVDLHRHRMQGFGEMDESSKSGFFGEK